MITKKRIFVLGPILSEWSEICTIAQALNFLSSDDHLEFFDPLEHFLVEKRENFLMRWFDRMRVLLKKYDAFFGFSMGGIILQQCFEQTEFRNKKIILFSTPSFVDEDLQEKIEKIWAHLQKRQLSTAMRLLHSYVSSSDPILMEHPEHEEAEHRLMRLQNGFEFVLKTDSRIVLQKTKMPYLHFIGEYSKLVTQKNVITNLPAKLRIVPSAGMRVLQDNAQDCVERIHHFLQDDHTCMH